MPGVKKWFLTLSFLVFVTLLAVPAGAWQFSMTGGMYWTYEFYNQAGNEGFFGP